jgi:GT2 family glycosyltransferase/glycosyltransferase involved in cell wall biosynthesis
MADRETSNTRPVQLHVIHDLGGGSTKWLRDYVEADATRTNLVLKSFTQTAAAGGGVALYANATDDSPLRLWKFAEEIEGTVATHTEHRAALAEIIRDYDVGALLVSSLIGHSLETLDTGLPTVVVNHDYFPYCPAINIHFGGTCRQCDANRIVECHAGNPRFNPFVRFMPPERIAVRARFMELIRRPECIMAVPSQSVAENLVRLNPLFTEVAFATIPHGYGHPLQKAPAQEPASDDRLRIVVLGQLSVPKGLELLRAALAELTRFAEIYLVGCKELGEIFKFEPHVHVTSDYRLADLPIHFANINPHVALLMSIVPETFSYALTELMMLGVPAAATRVGSFEDRIRHAENGYLYEPNVASLVAAMKAIDADRAVLGAIRERLQDWKPRTPGQMVSDYHRITPIESMPQTESRPAVPAASPTSGAADVAYATQALTLSSMWKDVKSLNLQLSVVNEARQRTENERQKIERQFREHRKAYEAQVADLAKQLENVIADKDRSLDNLSTQLVQKNAQLAHMLSSTSWRISSPIRYVGDRIRKVRILARCLAALARDRASFRGNVARLVDAWRGGGLREVKLTLLGFLGGNGQGNAWREYRETFQREVRPRIVDRIRGMTSRPRVAVIVPTYDTNEAMLREMLQSVRSQLYPEWELCIADDGSTKPHVRRVLEEYASKDRRIHLHFGENRGVSHASNRALEMVTANFVVLLDHDDVLEEQALFRVAESILEDQPDMVYSDEVLVALDATVVRRFAYRPAFSKEYLRSHPYIVHLVGFRTQLLRSIGGFDESLRISQDYDLILRVAEKARTIVHIPEILYQWRLHAGSAGRQRMDEVMRTSKAVLQRHLERSGETGTVHDGSSFNLFDVRYPLDPALRVAIIIPTKNHGDLLRQCIDSIRSTVKGVAYDIVVVDHESDDRETVEYLASIAASGIKVLRYEGIFNFSAINNWAVGQLAGPYSHYLFCNNDIEAREEGWLERMLELGQQPAIGIVGAKLLYPDGKTIQHGGVCVGAYGAAEHYGKRLRYPGDPVEAGFGELLQMNHEVAAVTAACMLIRQEAFREVGGFDEAILVGFGDVDLCLRIGAKGYRILFCPHAQLLHHESYTRGSSSSDPHPADSALYRFKWRELLQAGDPYYSPGLSLFSTNWALKQPLHCDFGVRRRIVRRASGRDDVSFSPAQAA